MDDVDFAVLLRLFGGPFGPRAGHQVIGAVVLFEADEVEGNSAELPRPAALQEHHLVVVGDVPVKREKGPT